MGEQSFILLVITVQGFCGSATLSLSTVGGNHHSRLLLTYESKAALCFIFYFCLSRYFPHVLWSYLLTWALKVAKIQNIFSISLYRQEKEPKFLQLTSFEQSFFFLRMRDFTKKNIKRVIIIDDKHFVYQNNFFV